MAIPTVKCISEACNCNIAYIYALDFAEREISLFRPFLFCLDKLRRYNVRDIHTVKIICCTAKTFVLHAQ